MERIVRFDRSEAIEFLDFRDPSAYELARGRFTQDDLTREMHALLPDGTWRIGYYAWAEIVGRLPGTEFRWPFLAVPGASCVRAIMLLPPVAEAGRRLYRLLAEHRYCLSKLLGLPAPCGSAGPCTIAEHAAIRPIPASAERTPS